jgi:hypothetical protein
VELHSRFFENYPLFVIAEEWGNNWDSGAVEKVASRFQSENKIIRQFLLLLP